MTSQRLMLLGQQQSDNSNKPVIVPVYPRNRSPKGAEETHHSRKIPLTENISPQINMKANESPGENASTNIKRIPIIDGSTPSERKHLEPSRAKPQNANDSGVVTDRSFIFSDTRNVSGSGQNARPTPFEITSTCKSAPCISRNFSHYN